MKKIAFPLGGTAVLAGLVKGPGMPFWVALAVLTLVVLGCATGLVHDLVRRLDRPQGGRLADNLFRVVDAFRSRR